MHNRAEKIENYRKQLAEEMGIASKVVRQFKRPEERKFLAKEREDVTLIFGGGLTETHEILMKGALEGQGYNAEYMPTPDNEALAIGKEYCNRGQCNPTYYTVGNLIKYLRNLKESGVENIVEKYVFVTAGACGPCRFGTYEAEYRKALTESGFDGFRVLTVNQSVHTEGENEEAGLRLDKDFYVSIVKAIMVGDLLNEICNKLRPYEVNEGETDRALKKSLEGLYLAIKHKKALFFPLRKARKILGTVSVDFSKVKPKVQIIGEFWAQTTEGDGNYRLQRWLQEEGCEVLTSPVCGWVDYMIWLTKDSVKDALRANKKFKDKKFHLVTYIKLQIAYAMLIHFHTLYRSALGFVNARLPSQKKLARLSHDYYNTKITGGEGHLEVAKNISCIKEKKAHLVISVKPFGCMPSLQSDGVQSKVMTDLKEGLFIPIETSGDGEVNVKSRVQMKLHEARVAAREEFNRYLAEAGITIDAWKKLAQVNRGSALSLLKLPHSLSTTAGNFAYYLKNKS